MWYKYYKIELYENKDDSLDDIKLPFKGDVKSMSWLKYDGDDGDLKPGLRIENESLAMSILIQNLKEVEHTFVGSNIPNENRKAGEKHIEIKNKSDLEDIIFGRYEKVFVSTYYSERFQK